MHGIFDVEFAAEIEEAITARVWSDLPQEVVQKMVESAGNHIEMAELDPPPRKVIIKRLRDFYANRRSLALVRDNPDKRRSRRAALKMQFYALCKLNLSCYQSGITHMVNRRNARNQSDQPFIVERFLQPMNEQ